MDRRRDEALASRKFMTTNELEAEYKRRKIDGALDEPFLTKKTSKQ